MIEYKNKLNLFPKYKLYKYIDTVCIYSDNVINLLAININI